MSDNQNPTHAFWSTQVRFVCLLLLAATIEIDEGLIHRVFLISLFV